MVGCIESPHLEGLSTRGGVKKGLAEADALYCAQDGAGDICGEDSDAVEELE